MCYDYKENNSKTINKLRYKTELKFSSVEQMLISIENYKVYTIQKILEQIWFYQNEETRLLIKEVIKKRKNGLVLFNNTLKNMQQNLITVSTEEINQLKKEFNDLDYLPYLKEENKYIIWKSQMYYMRAYMRLKKIGLEDMIDVVNYDVEILMIESIYGEYATKLQSAPLKSTDSNAAKKGVVTRSKYLKPIREVIEAIFIEMAKLSNYEMTPTHSQKLTRNLINLLTN